MKIIGIIPSRFASTRLPGKPLADLCGKPMIQRVYEQASKATLISDVIVATDDDRIRSAVTAFGGTVQMTSPKIQSGSDRIALAARSLRADIVVNIQGDEPLIDPNLIDETIQALIDDPDAVVSTAVKRITSHDDLFNAHVVKAVLDEQNNALYFSRSPIPFIRDAKKDSDWLTTAVFYKHFGLYVYRSDFLQRFTSLAPSALERAEQLEQLRILEHGFRIKCIVTEYESFPVDTPEDVQRIIERITRS